MKATRRRAFLPARGEVQRVCLISGYGRHCYRGSLGLARRVRMYRALSEGGRSVGEGSIEGRVRTWASVRIASIS